MSWRNIDSGSPELCGTELTLSSKDVKTVLSNNLTKPYILTHTFCSVTTEQITYILDHLLMLLQNIFNQTLYVTYERTQSMCFCLSEFSLKKMTKNSSFSVWAPNIKKVCHWYITRVYWVNEVNAAFHKINFTSYLLLGVIGNRLRIGYLFHNFRYNFFFEKPDSSHL